MRFTKPLLSLALFLSTAASSQAAETPELRKLFPDEVLLYAEIGNGRSLYDAFLASAGWKVFTQTPAFTNLMESPGLQRFEAGRRIGANYLGADPLELTLQALGRKTALAVWQRGEGDFGAGLVALPDQDVKAAYNRLADLAVMDAKNRRVSKGGCDVLIFEKGAMALGSAALSFATDEELAVKLAKGLRSAKKADSEPGFLFTLDLQALRRIQGQPDGPQDPDNPLGVLVAGGWSRILRAATELHVTGHVRDGALALDASVNAGISAIDEKFRNLFAPPAAAPTELAGESQIASISLARDFALWWQLRRSLFPPADLPGLAETENVLNAFFSGPAEEVFAGLRPRLTLLAAPQSFEASAGAPRLELPAFALQARLSQPETIGPRFVQAFQTGVVLTNLDRAQKGAGEPLSIETAPVQDGLRLVQARFRQGAAEPESTDDGLRYNLSPACGVRGDKLVLASAEGIARELLSAEAQESAGAGPADLLVIHAGPLAEALTAAMPMMVTNQMLENGKSREQATADLETFVAVVRAFEGLRAELHYDADRTRLALELAGRKEAQ